MPWQGILLVAFTAICHVDSALAGNGTTSSAVGCPRDVVFPEDVAGAVGAAKDLLSRLRYPNIKTDLKDRLAIHMLNSVGFSSGRLDEIRQNVVRCNLMVMQQRVLPHTPYDLFMWTADGIVPPWLNETHFQRIFVMKIPQRAWSVPCGLRPRSEWVGYPGFATDYFLMGRWRLAFAPAFSRAMGYSYFAHWDTDAVPSEELSVNIVDAMREGGGRDMGVYSGQGGAGTEKASMLLGIAEFAAFFMHSEGYLNPEGPIFKHVSPASLSGLNSAGFDRQYFRGFFTVLSVDFWFKPIVQRFLNLVMIMGKDIEMRWQEQGVINMMRLLFVPEARLFTLNSGIFHEHSQRIVFSKMCLGPPLYVNYLNLTELHAGLR